MVAIVSVFYSRPPGSDSGSDMSLARSSTESCGDITFRLVKHEVTPILYVVMVICMSLFFHGIYMILTYTLRLCY